MNGQRMSEVPFSKPKNTSNTTPWRVLVCRDTSVNMWVVGTTQTFELTLTTTVFLLAVIAQQVDTMKITVLELGDPNHLNRTTCQVDPMVYFGRETFFKRFLTFDNHFFR